MKKQNKVPRVVSRAFPGVVRAVDARVPALVTVTGRDCGKRARVKDPGACAMARACKRQYRADGAIIGLSKSYIIKGNVATRYTTPESVAREITSFDRSAGFAPGKYHLRPPCAAQRLNHKRRSPAWSATSGSHPKRHVVHGRTSSARVLAS